MRRMLNLAVVLGLLAAAPSATAAVRTVTIADPLDMQEVEFEPQYRTDVEQLSVTYDEVGTVSFAMTFFQDEPEATLTASFDLGPRCSSEAEPTLTVSASHTPGGFSYGAATMTGYADSLDVAPTRDGRTLVASVSHPALAGQAFRCVFGAYGYGDDVEFDDLANTWFAGQEPLVLNPTTALAQAEAALVARFGGAYTGSSRKWLECPKQEIFRIKGVPLAICEFEFRAGTGYRGGGLNVRLDDNAFRVEDLYVSSYTKRVRRCSIRSERKGLPKRVRLDRRSLRASKSLDCRDLVGAAGMVGDIEYDVASRHPRGLRRPYRVGFHGTNRAGFEDRVVFPCKVRRRGDRYSLRCANALGDRFAYAFTVVKPAPRKHKPSPGPSCDPNYAGACLDPNAVDYDCEGGSGNGPKYTGEVRVVGDDHYGLDADGDGIGCET